MDKKGKPTLTRVFVEFILQPIIKVTEACLENDKPMIKKMIEVMKVKLTSEEKDLQGKYLQRAILKKWINASDALLEMMVVHLPSPKKA